jgi:phosphatidylglycerophosphatase A
VSAEPPSSELAAPSAPTPDLAGQPATAPKPRFALLVASVCGLGYIPIAPGTFGSLAGLVLFGLVWCALMGARWILRPFAVGDIIARGRTVDIIQFVVAAITAAMGVWSARRAASFWQQKDPQRVVIDEVSGQHLAVVLGLAAPLWQKPAQIVWGGTVGRIPFPSLLSWKYLVLGFILFRVFDIWKPFPVRQAESLPGGWGIMTDDWVAGAYAAIGLWIARVAGL